MRGKLAWDGLLVFTGLGQLLLFRLGQGREARRDGKLEVGWQFVLPLLDEILIACFAAYLLFICD